MLANKHLLWCILACASYAVNGLALPAPDAPSGNKVHCRDNSASKAKGFGNGMALRIMPLGASITFGFRSTDKNGYRKDLRDQLEKNGNKVNMVRDKQSGDMKDNENEGWSSYTISQVREKADKSVPKYKPNLVLINAGTNDCTGNVDLAKAGNRMTDLLNDVFKASPKATVILSTLLVNKNPDVEKRVKDFNDQMKAVASKFQLYGKRLVLVDMHSDKGPTKEDLADDTHPNDLGYKKMADIWYAGIKEADARHYLQEAEPVDGLAPDGA